MPFTCLTSCVFTIVGVSCLLLVAKSLNNGLGLTPQMGYNTWYDLGCDITEDLVRETANKFIELGLNNYGYEYINVDDCWAAGRYNNGTVYTDNSTFNSPSLKPLADYIHSLNLKFGVYTDRGTKTCAGRPGSQNYEQLDANTYANWGVDYVKEDSCNTVNSNNITLGYEQYALMRDSLNNTKREIFFSLCGWNSWYSNIGMNLGNSWRIGPDDTNWNGILVNIDINSQLYSYCGIGGWNDPCLLLGEDMNNNLRITQLQTRAQFSMWAIMSSPLLLSINLRNISNINYETITNKWVININQDKAGKQGKRIVGMSLTNYDKLIKQNKSYIYKSEDIIINNDIKNGYGYNIWVKELIDGSRAFVFLNVANDTLNITCDANCFNQTGMANLNVKIYDLWNNNQMIDVINTNNGYTAINVAPQGGVSMLKMTPHY